MMSHNPQMPLATPQLAGLEIAVAGQVMGSTPWTHVECAQGWKIPDPVMGYYTRLPPHAACKWSTDHGKLEKHTIDHPLPSRQLSHWTDARLRERAAYYRRKFPEDMFGLTRPYRFEDLYEYFDGKDLYFQGAWNSWNLVNMLVDENFYLEPAIHDAQRAETDAWVAAWGGKHINRQKLMAWDRNVDVLTVLGPEDWDRNIGGVVDLDDRQKGMLQVSLVNFYRVLANPHYSGSPPFHAQRESQSGHPVAIWLDKTQSPSERITPPLNNISEEGHFQVPAGRVEVIERARTHPRAPVIVNGSKGIPPNPRRSLDASPLAKKGKHDGSDTSTMRAVSGTSSTKGGSPDSVETWKSGAFFKPGKPSKGQVATKTHQVTQSVPSVGTEPFPKLADSNIPFPYNGMAEDELSKDQHVAGENSFDEQTPRAVNGAQRPQTVAPIQQMSNANGVQGFPPTQRMQQMPPPPVTQSNVSHKVNSYQTTNNSSQPAQVPIMEGPVNSQAPSAHIYGLPPPIPQEFIATNGAQHVQYQRAMLYPGQPAQAHGPHAAPQMNPQQIAVAHHMATMPMPSYAMNGLVQSQENEAQNRSHSNSTRGQRNSPPRNGWRTKIRDDPIHGAVYVHNNLRRNTMVKGVGYKSPQPRQHQEQGDAQNRGLHVDCRNDNRNRAGRNTTYSPCDCPRCLSATRSVFLREFNRNVSDNKETRQALTSFFQKWGEVEAVSFRNPSFRHMQLYAFVRFKHEMHAFAAITSFQGKEIAIPGLGERIFVGFPRYSRFFGCDANSQEVRASVFGMNAAASTALPSDQPLKSMHPEMQPYRTGPVSNRNEQTMAPYPGFGHSGGRLCGMGFPLVLLHSNQSSRKLKSLEMVIVDLHRGRSCIVRSQEDGGSEPMDLVSTSSSRPTSLIESRSRVELPTTPPKQRDVSSSPVAEPSQGPKTVRPQAHTTVPKQPAALAPSSSSISDGFRPRLARRLSDSTSSNGDSQKPADKIHQDKAGAKEINTEPQSGSISEGFRPRRIELRLADSTSSSDEFQGAVKRIPPGEAVAMETDLTTVALPPTQEDPLPTTESFSSNGDKVEGQEGHLPNSKRLNNDSRLPTEASPMNKQSQVSANQAETLSETVNEHRDKKVKHKGNKTKKKPTKEQAQASTVNATNEHTETQRPPSSASQGSSVTDPQQLPKKKKRNSWRKKRVQSSETAQNVDAAHESSGNAADNEEEKTEDYKAKIKNLFSAAEEPKDAPPREMPKDPQPAVENMRKGYRANAGGSLKMQKSRPPALSPNTFKSPEKSEASQLPTIVESASTVARTLQPEVSPTAYAFTNQKFEIDQIKSKEHSAEQGKSEDPKPQPKPQARLTSFPPGFDPYPRPQSPRPASRDDVFSPKKDDKQVEEWMHTESVRKTMTKKKSPVITPSPSPRNAVLASPSSTRSSLNPSAKPFVVPTSRPLTPTAAMLTVGAKHGRQDSHISTHSSAPSTSSRSGNRFFTPIEQTPQRASTPPSPRKAKQPQRRNPSGGAQGPQNHTDNRGRRGGARPQQPREQAKKKPVEPTPPKLNVANFPELPAAKKPMVEEAHAPKITLPSNTWRKSKETTSSSASPKEQDKASPNKDGNHSPPQKDPMSPAEVLLEQHRRESLSIQNVQA